jgi:hypothetical protein
VHKYAGDVVIDDHAHHKFKDDAQPGHMVKAMYRECGGEQLVGRVKNGWTVPGIMALADPSVGMAGSTVA